MNASIRRFASALVAATGLAVGIGASSASATPFISTDPRRDRHSSTTTTSSP